MQYSSSPSSALLSTIAAPPPPPTSSPSSPFGPHPARPPPPTPPAPATRLRFKDASSAAASMPGPRMPLSRLAAAGPMSRGGGASAARLRESAPLSAKPAASTGCRLAPAGPAPRACRESETLGKLVDCAAAPRVRGRAPPMSSSPRSAASKASSVFIMSPPPPAPAPVRR